VMAERPPHDVLSDCLERWEQGQGGVEEFLAQHPELREELEPLLGLAVELWALPKIKAPDRLRQDPLWRRPPSRGPLGVRRPRAKAPLLPFPLVGRSARPEDVLDECLARIKHDGASAADEVLTRHPKQRAEIAPLLGLADDLAALRDVRAPDRLRQDPLWRRAASPAPQTLPQWAAAARDQETAAPPPPAPIQRSRRRVIVSGLSRLAAGVGGATLAALLVGTVVTSATSLPDEPLYPVKRLVEDAQLVITPPESRVEVHLRRAQERVKETQEMIERDRTEAVPALVDAYVREVDAVRQELQTPRTRTAEPERVEKVITRLEANEQVLGAIAQRVAEPARPAVARAVEATRPESVAPRTDSAPESLAPSVESAPEAVAPAESPGRIAPAAAPTFGLGGAASVREAPQRSTVRQLLEATATPTPGQVRAPAVGASILPNPNSTTATGSSSGASASPTAAPSASPAPTTAAPVLGASATPTKPPTTGPQPSPTAVFQLLPTIAPASSAAPSNTGATQKPLPSAGSPSVRPLVSPTGRSAEPAESQPLERTSSPPTLAPSAGSARSTP